MADITPDQYEQPSEALPMRLVRADGSAFEDLRALLGDPASPGAGSVNERLQALFGRLGDGTAIARASRAYAAARPVVAEGERAEGLVNRRGMPWAAQTFSALPGHQVRVHRQGTRAINSTTYQLLTNSTAAVSGFPTQDIDHTVAAGKRLLITSFSLVLLLPNNDIRVTGRLRVAGTPRFVTSTGTGTAATLFGASSPAHAGGSAITPPFEVAAGQAITVDVASSANVNVWMAWDGIEEALDA